MTAKPKPKPLIMTNAFSGPQRERFAGYPSADAYAVQYESKRDDKGKVVYQIRVDRQGNEKTHPRTGKALFKLDADGKKIPVLDETRPKRGKDGQVEKKKVAQLPWGYVVKDTGVRTTWREGPKGKKKAVTYAECRRRVGGSFRRKRVWIRADQLQDERCMEVSFVDIGQGDGCFLVTPEDRRMVIDAGESDNMRRFLNWRHGTSKKTTFEAGIISHPDSDHYGGFEELFHRKNFTFETVYTNGLMESAVPKKKKLADGTSLTGLGPKKVVTCDDGVKRTVVTKLVTTLDELTTFLDEKKQSNWVTRSKKNGKTTVSRKKFPSLLEEARTGRKLTQKFGDPDGKPTVSHGKTMGDIRAFVEASDDVLDEEIQRSVAVYGTITVVTDGVRAIIHQKLERKGSTGSYDIYRLEPSGVDKDGQPTGPLTCQSKH